MNSSWIRPCVSNAQAYAMRGGSPNIWVADLVCDIWPAHHVTGVFIMYCFLQNWPIVFLLTGLAEAYEAVGRAVNGGTAVPLLEDVEGGESMTNAIVDDWVIAGTIGLLLGGLFMYHLRTRALVDKHRWRQQRTSWWFYVLVVIASIGPTAFMPLFVIDTPPGVMNVAAFSTNKTDLWLGPGLISTFRAFLYAQAFVVEGRFSKAWVSEPPWKRSTFYSAQWAICGILEIQAPWDWFYSGAIQVYVLSGLMLVYMIILAIGRGQWQYFVTRFSSWARRGGSDDTDLTHPAE